MTGEIIDFSGKNWQAECIYRLIKKNHSNINGVLADSLIIKNFDNHREQGYTLEYKDMEISFAQNRNSEDIVVYPFKWKNNPNIEDDCKTKSKYFENRHFQEVFDFIFDFLGIDI